MHYGLDLLDDQKSHSVLLDSVQVEERRTSFALCDLRMAEHMNCFGYCGQASYFVQWVQEKMEEERMNQPEWSSYFVQWVQGKMEMEQEERMNQPER